MDNDFNDRIHFDNYAMTQEDRLDDLDKIIRDLSSRISDAHHQLLGKIDRLERDLEMAQRTIQRHDSTIDSQEAELRQLRNEIQHIERYNR